MSNYAWPALVTKNDAGYKITFPDWPDISIQSDDLSDAHRQAAAQLNYNVKKRMDMKSDIPSQSEFRPRNLPIEVDSAIAVRLDSYMKQQDLASVRENNELFQSYQLRLAAYLSDYRTRKEPIERVQENANSAAVEFASIGIRFCYVLNAGGLVVIPAIMELLPDPSDERLSMVIPAVLFAIGILLAAATNYLVYHLSIKAIESCNYELEATTKETLGFHYPPDDQAAHQIAIEKDRSKFIKLLGSVKKFHIWSVILFSFSIISFLSGVGFAIYKMQ